MEKISKYMDIYKVKFLFRECKKKKEADIDQTVCLTNKTSSYIVSVSVKLIQGICQSRHRDLSS